MIVAPTKALTLVVCGAAGGGGAEQAAAIRPTAGSKFLAERIH
jgi:hypothetical protein